MKKVNISQALNGRLDCARCQTSRSWIQTARTVARQYSTIYRLRCAHCGDEAVAKVIGGRYSSEAARVNARREYDALCKLQSAFPQDEQFGTLVPLGHLEYDGQVVVVTRLAAGFDLMHCIRSLDGAGLETACRSAGIWLKKLHESDVQDQKNNLGVTDKIGFLTDKYGAVLHDDLKTGAAFDLFAQYGSDLDALSVVAVRQHGDFKPENLLCDGARYVGLDISWRSMGAAVYDLAPFLNHLWLDGGVMTGLRTRRHYDSAESAFLSGYGNVGEMRSLRWAQLYFALCCMGEYRQRGRVAAGYAIWKVWPLVRRLVTQLQRAA